MNALTKYIAKGLGKQSVGEALKAGGWKVLIDGNLGETLIRHPGKDGADLVGVDEFGNKYFEKADAQVGRNRWVVYAKADNFKTQDASAVPAEWHGWLHFISDVNPSNHTFEKPIYAVQAKANMSGTSSRYVPKGHLQNAHRRTWLKYQRWDYKQSTVTDM